LWKLPGDPKKFYFNPDEITAFCFEGDCQQTLSHGTYRVDDEGLVRSLSYRCQHAGDSPRVILALLYLPPSLSTRFLSLYSVYPISRSTYYGVDSGTLGLKLSLFFDLIMATCLPEDKFVSSHLAANKSDRNLDVLKQSRKKIWERFHLCKCRAYCLPLTDYEYLGDLQHSSNLLPKREVIVNLQNSVLSRISAMVLSDTQDYSTALLKTSVAININYPHMKKDILTVLESLCVRSIPHCARALMLTAEYLAIRARGKGGLRSGPAANPAFTHIFESMKKHFAGIPNGSKDTIPRSVTVEAAARVDLFGGWLDTPPITLSANPSAVVNMAILVDGKKPIACHVRHVPDAGITIRCGDTTVLLSCSQDIYESYNKPRNPGALVCACLICVCVPSGPEDNLLETLQNRFGTTGLEIECTSCLPHGSGLGTSSTLAAAIIQALGLASGFHYSEKSICHAVLMVEQLLTTGGGWQDQVGCLYPGIKKGLTQIFQTLIESFFNKTDDCVDVEKIDIKEEFEKEINSRMVLVYTGKTRLAKNLLQEVVRGWFSGGPIREVIASLESNVVQFVDSIKEGTMPCELIELYYNAKKTLATGCEPEIVTCLISQLKRESLIETAWLAGAGGGGFLYVWLKDGISVDQVRTFISRCGTAEMTVHTVTVDNSPITVALK
uniref:GHMP_kinases_N domain-containing protein n=1 Tax=Haemonchus placei TaxID=6290 RepID=A0A0N4X117_HAEPC